MRLFPAIPLALTLAVGVARAQPAEGEVPAAADPVDDGFCDYVEGVAGAESALLMAPDVFASLGYLDQPGIVAAPETSTTEERFILGARYSLTNLYQGFVVRSRAAANCRRDRALRAVKGETTARALMARAAVLEKALVQANKILERASDDLEARRQTLQDVTATRLRVDEIRALAAQTRAELGTLPKPKEGLPMARSLETYYEADDDVERLEGRLRRARAWDLNVRVGYDSFLAEVEGESPYFAVATVGLNLGWFLQGGANARAADGRRRYRREEQGPDLLGATKEQMRQVLESETRRMEQTGVLVADLEKQLESLRDVISDNGRRYRQSLWFDWVKLKAENAYLTAHVESLKAVVGELPE